MATGRLRYGKSQPLDRATAAAALRSGDAAAVCNALVSVAFHEPDWRWVQGECLRLAKHPAAEVRGVAAVCLGHLARIHAVLDEAPVGRVLAELERDPDPYVRGCVADARDDLAVFLARREGQ